MIRLETVLDSWKTIREDAAAAVEEFPAADFEFKPVPEVAAFGEIARHILDAGHCLSGLLLAGEDDFTAPDFRRKLAQHVFPLPEKPAQAELAGAMRQSLGERLCALATQTPEWWAKVITRFDGQQVTRLEMIQFVKEHELTHRSQLFMYLRLKGLVPVTTRRRQARK